MTDLRWARFSTLILLAALSGGCAAGNGPGTDASGLPTSRPIVQSDLRDRPVARLVYPGSTLVKTVGADQTRNPQGDEPNPAYTGAIRVAPATTAQLYSWYGRWMQIHGFRAATYYRQADESSGQAWAWHHRLQLQLGVFEPMALAADQGIRFAVPPGSIIYEAVVVGYSTGLPKY